MIKHLLMLMVAALMIATFAPRIASAASQTKARPNHWVTTVMTTAQAILPAQITTATISRPDMVVAAQHAAHRYDYASHQCTHGSDAGQLVSGNYGSGRFKSQPCHNHC